MKILLPIFLLFSVSLSAQIKWQNTKGTEGAPIIKIYSNSQFAFVFDAFAMYRTTDGKSWQQIDQPDLYAVALNDTKMVALQNYYQYAQTGDKNIFSFVVSLDQGLTWQKRKSPPTASGGFFNDIAVSSHGIYVSDGSVGKLYRSVDDGLSWDSIPVVTQYSYDIYQFNDRIYIQANNSIYLLDPVGLTWTNITDQIGQHDYINGWYAQNDTFLLSTQGEVFSSLDAGLTWSRSDFPNQNNLVAFARSGNRFYANKEWNRLYSSDDFGKTWQPSAPLASLVFLSNIGNTVLVSTVTKGIQRLDESSMTFVDANSGLYSGTVSGLAIVNEKLYASGSHGLYEYDIKDQLWDYQALLPSSAQYGLITVKASPAGKLATMNQYSDTLNLSADGGLTWQTRDLGQIIWTSIENLYWVGERLCVQGGNGVQCSSNYGQIWTPQIIDFMNDPVSFKGKYYGLGYDVLYTSSDTDPYWTASTNPLPSTFQFLTATKDKLFGLALSGDWSLGTLQSALYTSSDGISWEYANDGLPFVEEHTSWHEQPKTAVLQSGSSYYFHSPSVGIFQSIDSCKTWVPYIWTQYGTSVAIFDTTIFAGSYGGGVVKVSTQNTSQSTVKRGIVYKDENKNGQFDSGEAQLPNVRINLKQSGNWFPYWFTTTNQEGKFAISTSSTSVDTLRPILPDTSLVKAIFPDYRLTDAPSNSEFGVQFKYDTTSLAITGSYLAGPRPGFNLSIGLVVNNTGSLPANGQFGVKFDSDFQFTGATPPPTQIIGTDSAVWALPNIPIFSSAYFRIDGTINQQAQLGSTLKTVATLYTSGQDYNKQDDQVTLCDTIVGSYDPNDKRVEPSIGLTHDEITNGKELIYTIRFQNTGTSLAEKVRITDLLSSQLDYTTFRFVGSSHRVTSLRMQQGGLLEFVFDQINLPDSTSNEPGSHGFVRFSLQRKKAYAPNFQIDNKAAIFFDFNDPIITNTVKTQLYTPTTISTHQPPQLVVAKNLVSPNPNQGSFQIELEPPFTSDALVQLAIYAENGQLVNISQLQPTNGLVKVNRLDLPSGCYLLQLRQNHKMQSLKVLIQR
jgi:uncharacterized repeat protein (TIGR01451 family)